jgi:hypothetical protein
MADQNGGNSSCAKQNFLRREGTPFAHNTIVFTKTAKRNYGKIGNKNCIRLTSAHTRSSSGCGDLVERSQVRPLEDPLRVQWKKGAPTYLQGQPAAFFSSRRSNWLMKLFVSKILTNEFRSNSYYSSKQTSQPNATEDLYSLQ